ncbi:hypothetical protein N752_25230 [Desulforamulus aquiferis]|nr:hypothetical protein N752_25230 [Desulforamulus aquiferis]
MLQTRLFITLTQHMLILVVIIIMKLNIKVPENIDALSKLLSLIAVLVFLHFFFKNLTVLIGQIIQSRTGSIALPCPWTHPCQTF